uniref:Uncharacterized protein LOC111133175 isoform X1 n=1 Tax=Crassostrea virginica TaxID=6565 RepID=A0A8B8EBF6_CRAVI|nr:uncharacterized protein LOC111133175 isoform X1 [Crassostrea virginica]
MDRCLIICVVLLILDLKALGFLLNSPCKKTTDWDNYHLQCETNHKIYLRHHTIEDGFEKLLFPALGCTSRDALYCGADLPNNNNINLQNDVFVNAVKHCNGKTDCILRTDYFTKAEKSVRDSCDTSTHPDLQNAKFRQSMEYECIPESPMLDMCTRGSENRSQHIYLEAFSNGPQRNCSCHVTGSASKVEILQTISSQVQIFSNDSFVLDHQNPRLGIYGMVIPVNADKLTVTLLDVSNESLALIKIVGNVLVECNKPKLLRAFRRNLSLPATVTTVEAAMSLMIDATIETTRPFSVGPQLNTVHLDSEMQAGALDILQISLIILSFFLLAFLLMTNFNRRTIENKSAEISIDNVKERLVLIIQPSQENRLTKIEMIKADCLCDRSNHGNRQSALYTPLQIENCVTNQIPDTSEYLTVTE